ncbi:MAG: polysaccharide pyruvyl transferase family protein [Butyrivibrio sp.]|nr:polysaccharide pyruvyl transferase family protein [Butyrivibrio sp.]
MKIGILTYHTPSNFGANLQAFASSKYFESIGHTAKIINFCLEGNGGEIVPAEQREAHRYFSQEILNVTRIVKTGEEILKVVEEEGFDVVAIGADAVWSKSNRKRLEVFHANWLWGSELEKKVRVIALSPAFMGADYHDLTPTQRQNFKNSLLKFHDINARDEWTRDAINREIIGCEYIKKINPDPVFLINSLCKKEWDKRDSQIESNKYYIVSLPKNDNMRFGFIKRLWLKRLKKELHNRGYKMVELPTPDGYSGFDDFDYIVKYPIDPMQWYLWLKNAKGFIGLRFHAIVSCFSAGTSFYSFDSYCYLPKWKRFLNLLGFHRNDHKWAYKSKIRNLLEGSGFESFRMNGAQYYTLNPIKIVEKIESVETGDIFAFRDCMIATFKSNMDQALKD